MDPAAGGLGGGEPVVPAMGQVADVDVQRGPKLID